MSFQQCARRAAWLLVFAIAVFTLSPIHLRPTTSASAGLERFAAYALIGATFYLAYPRLRLVTVILTILGIAGALEALQHLAPGRHGRFDDFVVKAAGAMAGIVPASIAQWVLRLAETKSTVSQTR